MEIVRWLYLGIFVVAALVSAGWRGAKSLGCASGLAASHRCLKHAVVLRSVPQSHISCGWRSYR
jgi:hypothetical protein